LNVLKTQCLDPNSTDPIFRRSITVDEITNAK
jgi:hypothetical protein